MALTLQISNFSSNNILEKAKVALDTAKGQPTFTIDNPQNIAANDYLLLDRVGGSMSRIYQVLSVSGNTVTLTENLKADLIRGADVTKLFGSKIKVYRAPYQEGVTPQISDYLPLTGGLIDIDADQAATLFTDLTGSELFWYRNTYYNPTTTNETSLADSTASRDVRSTSYSSIDDIRNEAGFKWADQVTDEMIDVKRQAAQAEINGALVGRYALPFSAPIDPFLSDLATRLAAGQLMCQQFGSYDGNGKTLGAQKRDDAREDLKKLSTGVISLTNAQGIQTAKDGGASFSSGFTADNLPRFTNDMLYGYNERQY